MLLGARRWLCLVVFLAGWGCSAAPAPRPLAAAPLRQAVLAARTDMEGYTATLELTFMGPQGRYRGRASLRVERPDRLRYELYGPHGGVVLALACDGAQLDVLSMDGPHLRRGPAQAATLDRVLGLGPLGLGPAGWVALLLGEVVPPGEATLAAQQVGDARQLSWHLGDRTVRLGLGAEGGRPHWLEVERAGGARVLAVQIGRRDGLGLPVALQLQAPAAGTEVAIRLLDVEAVDGSAGATPGTFALGPIPGLAVEPL